MATIEKQNSNKSQQPMGLWDKSMPLMAATAAQLRTPRRLIFKGMRCEAGGLQQAVARTSALACGACAGDGRQAVKPMASVGFRGNILAPGRVSIDSRRMLYSDYGSGEHGPGSSGRGSGTNSRPACALTHAGKCPKYMEPLSVAERGTNAKHGDDDHYGQKAGIGYRQAAGAGAAKCMLEDLAVNRSAGTQSAASMDYITLVGYLLGCLASHMLFLLCWYFNWLKGQVVKLRRHFLGHSNLWEFFDFEDNTRYSMQTKLLLAPVILACSLLYCVVNLLHLVVKVVRSDVPRTVVEFVQRVGSSTAFVSKPKGNGD